jgi:hypothetical protein
MAKTDSGRIGILWRGERTTDSINTAEKGRLQPIFEALRARGVLPEPVVFSDDAVDGVRQQLLQLDGVLVWVDPIMGDTDRTNLDALLREAASERAWVSAHPDVILKMGTKEVLFRTRELGWGGDIYLYESHQQLKREFPARLASGPRVVKQNRGNGGIGVWKVVLTTANGADSMVRIQHALPRDTATDEIPLTDFFQRCEAYFSSDGRMIDQPFQPRIVEGMIRAYMVKDEVVGFARQYPEGLSPDDAAATRVAEAPQNILGLPAKKTMYPATEAQFTALRSHLESDWIAGMQRLVDVDRHSLPMLWDADFLYGPKTPSGDDTYVLCEINVSSVAPFPPQAVAKLADAVLARLKGDKTSASAKAV